MKSHNSSFDVENLDAFFPMIFFVCKTPFSREQCVDEIVSRCFAFPNVENVPVVLKLPHAPFCAFFSLVKPQGIC